MTVSVRKPDSAIEFRGGRPLIVFDGEPIAPAIYMDAKIGVPQLPHARPDLWLDRQRQFRDSGVHVYCVSPVRFVDGNRTTRFWTDDGVYPDCSPDDEPFCLDRQAEALLEMDPEAVLFVRFADTVPPSWFEKNRDQLQTPSPEIENAPLKRQHASLSSTKALDDLCRYIQRLLEYVERQPWAERVVGYVYYPGGEGTTTLTNAGCMFDHSPVHQRAFADWLHQRYGSQDALRDAWQDADLRFDQILIPRDEQWRAARARTGHWPDDPFFARMRDYFRFQRDMHMHWYKTLVRRTRTALTDRQTIFGIDTGKVPLLGWQLHLTMRGGGGPELVDTFAGSGHLDYAELLDEPGLDILMTPADYTARMVGHGFEPEGIADSLHLRGKTILCENDARTIAPGESETMGAFNTPEEVRAGLLRNSAWSLTRGHIDYWMIAGGAYFDDPVVQTHGIQSVVPILNASVHWPHEETEHAVALILDDTAPMHTNGTVGYHNIANIWQRILGLAHCGIPYRIYMFSDLAHDNMPDYRCYLFPNLFELNSDRLELLRRKVLRDGRMAIFGPATGITDGDRLGAEGATELLGVEMKLVTDHQAQHRVIVGGKHPIAAAMRSNQTYGDSMPYGPILCPAEKSSVTHAGGHVLGEANTFWQINRPGLFIRDARETGDGDYTVAWSIAAPLPANLIRELARHGGCNVWCEEDEVVFASETVAALHTNSPGRRTLQLPSPRTTWDLLTGESLGVIDRIEMDLTPPETRLFYFGDESPYRS